MPPDMNTGDLRGPSASAGGLGPVAPRPWPPAVKLVMGARLARSVGQGALVVGFTLYLHALGWSAAGIGEVLSAGLLFGVALTLLVGPASDRLGRKGFLLAYEGVLVVSALLALASSRPWVLVLGAVLGGFGRGANGAAGPFGPLEQAWLAQGLDAGERPRVFSLNSTLGFTGMAVGALIAGLPAAWAGVLPGALAFRPLFALPLLGSLVGLVLVWVTLRSGRLGPAIFLHSGFNLLGVIVVLIPTDLLQ